MPRRSKIDGLPPEIKAELDRRLVEESFSGYHAFEDWLQVQGFEIGKSSIHRYAQEFESKLGNLARATEQARAIVEAAPDQEGAINEAILRLVQENLFNVLVNSGGDGLEPKDLATVARSIADVTRASITQKKFMEEVRAKLDAKFKNIEAKATTLDPDTIKRIKEEVYGIF